MRTWLITVVGYDMHYNPPHETATVEKELPDNITPLDWYRSGPSVYRRFRFTPRALLGFWEVKR
ncbi:MAG: hypothetical protein ACYTEQ_00890 [Planctomycetota bacterium]|jgi:hypothetical protein